MGQGTAEITISFGRRPGEATQRAILGSVLIAAMLFTVVKIVPLVPMFLIYHGRNATFAKATILPLVVLFIAFAGYMTWDIVRTLRNVVVDRRLPLVVVNESGVTLYGIGVRTIVPWSELLGVSVERFRSARFLRLDVRDGLLRGGAVKNGVSIGLQGLDGTAEAVVDAIRQYPDYRGQPKQLSAD